MSELADILEAIQSVSHNGKIRGLSPVEANRVGRAIEKAREGNRDDILDNGPSWLRRMADYWQDRIASDEQANLEFEVQALRCALHGPEVVKQKIASIQGNGSALAGQHVAGIERMGSGSRPTGAAVAGEGAAGAFDALRPWLRALEILDRAA